MEIEALGLLPLYSLDWTGLISVGGFRTCKALRWHITVLIRNQPEIAYTRPTRSLRSDHIHQQNGAKKDIFSI